jgi:hypothetical protein
MMRRNLLLTRLIGFPQINYARDCTLNFFTLRNQEHQRHFLVSVSSVHDYSPRLSQVCTFDHHLRETHSGKERVKQNRVFALLDTGSLPYRKKNNLFCNEFRDIFSNELPASPASIPPSKVNVDDKLWKVSRNRTPRPQSTANQADIVRQLAKLEEQGIIKKSNAAYYSQVLMVPKLVESKRK